MRYSPALFSGAAPKAWAWTRANEILRVLPAGSLAGGIEGPAGDLRDHLAHSNGALRGEGSSSVFDAGGRLCGVSIGNPIHRLAPFHPAASLSSTSAAKSLASQSRQRRLECLHDGPAGPIGLNDLTFDRREVYSPIFAAAYLEDRPAGGEACVIDDPSSHDRIPFGANGSV